MTIIPGSIFLEKGVREIEKGKEKKGKKGWSKGRGGDGRERRNEKGGE